ncbi:MAG: outer membrane beta-barrel protein [Ferruginibacter sp.]
MNLKIIFVVIAFNLAAFKSIAQDNRAFEKGNSIISLGYGVGNIWKKFLEDAVNYPPGTYKVSNQGTYTIIYEYAFTDKISAGVATGYSRVTGRFNTIVNGTELKFSETLTNFLLLARANYHIGKIKNFDPYIGGGLGYYHFSYYNDNPSLINSKTPGAFGYSAQLGMHYYFSDHVGSFLEVGYVGGSLVQFGISLKL